jgi:hypothetical protein
MYAINCAALFDRQKFPLGMIKGIQDKNSVAYF